MRLCEEVGVLVDVTNDVEVMLVDLPELDCSSVAVEVEAPPCLFLSDDRHDFGHFSQANKLSMGVVGLRIR